MLMAEWRSNTKTRGTITGFRVWWLGTSPKEAFSNTVSPDVGTYRFASDLGVCGSKALRTVANVLGMAGVWAIAYGWRIFLAFRV